MIPASTACAYDLAATPQSRRGLRVTDGYAALLAVLLVGLAVAGKAFAYLGVPPIYVTEVVLALGVLAWLRTGCVLGALATGPGLVLVVMMLWAAARTLPFVPAYGVDALRDSVLVFYGVFAFVVMGLLLQSPDRLRRALGFLRWFTGFYAVAGPLVFLLQYVVTIPALPTFPGTVALLVRASELGVHLSACAVLAILGLRPARAWWLCGLLAGIALVASQNRGGLLAILVPAAMALVVSRVRREVAAIVLAGVLVLGLGYAADLGMPNRLAGTADDNERALTVRQAVDNVLSLVTSGQDQQDNTKAWRLAWWNDVVDYTLHGPYFWTGKGFGVNLAVDDGYVAGNREASPLRSPHSSHLNMLARTGVPGLLLWITLILSWLWTVLGASWTAWRYNHAAWRNLLLFCACYWIASLIDSSFDVALEGPMIGAWFWCQTGFGLAVATIYRAELARTPA